MRFSGRVEVLPSCCPLCCLRRRPRFCLPATLLAVVGLWPASAPAQTTVERESFHYKMITPLDWTAEPEPGGHADLALISPRDHDDPFVENLNVIARYIEQPRAARALARRGIQNLQRTVEGFEVLHEDVFPIQGAEAYVVVYRAQRGGVTVQNSCYTVVRSSAAEPERPTLVLTITGAALAESHETFADRFDETVRSIRFLIPVEPEVVAPEHREPDSADDAAGENSEASSDGPVANTPADAPADPEDAMPNTEGNPVPDSEGAADVLDDSSGDASPSTDQKSESDTESETEPDSADHPASSDSSSESPESSDEPILPTEFPS